VRCKDRDGREMKDTKEVTFKGKGDTERRMLKGVCAVCGTKMCRMLPKK